MKILPQSFFNRPTTIVAKELIGCHLLRTNDGRTERFMITETEAYDGPDDLACHASKGRTKRTEVMFGPAGHIYTYFIYGMYWMLNIVTGPEDYPAAVLIRGVEDFAGPGKLTKRLQITGEQNRLKLSRETGLWIESSFLIIPEAKIRKTPRIGVDYAGPIWSKKKWRFVLQ